MPADTADSRAWFAHASDSTRSGEVVAGRYTLRDTLGQGAYGAVWRADDAVRGDQVALKFLKPRGDDRARQSLHEIATLRRLDVDGVARLRDYADEGGQILWLAMDLAPGEPFDPASGVTTWAEIGDATRRLLAILTEVHARGVVHRDLKPSNVFVDDGGGVTVLDFGVAWNPELAGANRKRVVGTPRYLAPEQLRGSPGDARTDLYAVGTMLYRALSGRWPHDVPKSKLFAAKLRLPPASLRDLAPHVPGPVAEVIDAMLSIRPQQRPGTAADVLARLDDPNAGDAFVAIVGQGDDPVDEATMMSWFAGPERILYLQSDATDALRARGADTRDRALALLQRWRRGRRCWASDGRIVLPRASLNRLADEHEATNTGPTARLSLEPRARITTLFEQVDSLLAKNDGQRAMPLLEILVREPLTDDERTKCIAWMCVAAMETTTSANVRMARYVLERYDATDDLDDVDRALRAHAAAEAGDTDTALSLWARLGRPELPHVDEKLAVLVMPLLVRCDEATRDRLVDDIFVPWAGSGRTLALQVLLVNAWADYLSYRFESAARGLERAAALRSGERSVALLSNAASAWLEAARFDRVDELVTTCLATTASRRDPNVLFRLHYLARTAAYRAGDDSGPDLEVVAEAAHHAQAATVLLLACGEAARAWRIGDIEVLGAVDTLARTARGGGQPAAMGRALISAMRQDLDPGAVEVVPLPAQAPPRIRVQYQHLVGEPLSEDALAPARRWFPTSSRGEVLTWAEVLSPRSGAG